MYLIWIMLAFLVLYMVRVVRGPDIWDRFLGLSLISVKIVIITILYASIRDTAFFLDIAIVYNLLWFICIIFTALFLLDSRRNINNDRRKSS